MEPLSETPSRQEIGDRARLILDMIDEKDANGDNLITAIYARSGALYTFTDWVEEQLGNHVNFQRPNINPLITDLEKLSNYKYKAAYEEVSRPETKVEKGRILLVYGKRFVDIFQLNEIKRAERRFIPRIGRALKKNPRFAGTKWNVYFLYYKDNNFRSEPVLGRAYLEIKDYQNVTLLNASEHPDEDYFGEAEEVFEKGPTILFLIWSQKPWDGSCILKHISTIKAQQYPLRITTVQRINISKVEHWS